MQIIRRFSAALAMVLSMYIFMASPMYAYVERLTRQRIEDGRMKNVSVLDGAEDSAGTPDAEETVPPAAESAELRAAMAEASPAAAPAACAQDAPAAETDIPALSVTVSDSGEKEIRETTIEGGLAIKNQTGYKTDIGELLLNGPGLTLPAGQPQILVIHTHSSEAYTPAGLDKYEASDDSRTEDTQYNIVRVGDELCAIFEGAGLNVIHDRGIYDYPSYTGSYTRSGQAIEDWLTKYPSIRMVIDVHRDALGENGIVYKTMAEEDGVCASQVMILIGTDESGLAHSAWRGNLALAMYLQQAVSTAHPTLMRPVQLVPQRYNQHLTPGSMILEVGSSGNTLQEALAAVRLFAQPAAVALTALVEQGG